MSSSGGRCVVAGAARGPRAGDDGRRVPAPGQDAGDGVGVAGCGPWTRARAHRARHALRRARVRVGALHRRAPRPWTLQGARHRTRGQTSRGSSCSSGSGGATGFRVSPRGSREAPGSRPKARDLRWRGGSRGVCSWRAVQLAVQWPAPRGLRRRRASRPLPPGRRAGAHGVLRRAAPLALGAAVYQVNVMVDGLMAEGLPDGGPTAHYFANRLQQFPLALIAVAATSAVFGPPGARHGDRRPCGRCTIARTSPSRPALPQRSGFALAEPVVEVAFERGAFGREGVERTAGALRVLCPAILRPARPGSWHAPTTRWATSSRR